MSPGGEAWLAFSQRESPTRRAFQNILNPWKHMLNEVKLHKGGGGIVQGLRLGPGKAPLMMRFSVQAVGDFMCCCGHDGSFFLMLAVCGRRALGA